MKEPNWYLKIHWRLFNILAKLFGYGLSFASLLFIVLVTLSIFGVSIGGAHYPGYLLVLFIVLLVMGILMTKAEPFYPKKYKEWFETHGKPKEENS